MVVRLFEKHMQDEGYTVCLTPYPDIKEYTKEENSCVNIIRVVDLKADSTIDRQQFSEQSCNINVTYAGKEAHLMSLIFFENREEADEVAGDDYMCWLVDRHELCLA